MEHGADSARGGRMISLVIPFLDERANLAPLHAAIQAALEPLDLQAELLFVDDGSSDGSAEAVAALHASDPRVRLIRLSRNFGHQAALTAGLAHAAGDAVITLDADLQHPPALIPELVRLWREEGYPVVNTVRRESARQGLAKGLSSRLFYRLLSRLSEVEVREGSADFRLLDRAVVDELARLPERHRFLRGLVPWLGFPQAEVPYSAPARREGASKYSLRRMLRLAVDGLTAFSSFPLQLASMAGLAVTGGAFLYFVYVLVQWARGAVVPGWASLMAAILFLGGAQLLALGILGQYLSRVYNEVKGRPLYVVRERRFFPQDRRP